MQRTILHCDMNAFFASVEMRGRPELRQVPMAVCGSIEERHGIVLAKNDLAKTYGVSTGEAIWQAKKKCPNLLTVSPHYEKYIEISRLARLLYEEYTDQVEPFGLDECWLDVTHSLRLFGSGRWIADTLRARMQRLLGVTISVGISFNKVFAKLGSDLKKPNATTEIPYRDFRNIVWQRPAQELFGVGRASLRVLRDCGIHTIGDIAQTSPQTLERRLGKCGILIWKYANGLDDSPVSKTCETFPIKSIGHGTTPPKDLCSAEEAWPLILALTQEISHKLRANKLCSAGISVSIRDRDLARKEWQAGLQEPTCSALTLAEAAYRLLCARYLWSKPLRSITVTAISLQPQNIPIQLNLFSDTQHMEKRNHAESIVDSLRQKYGEQIIGNAVLLGHQNADLKKEIHILPGNLLSRGSLSHVPLSESSST